MKQLLQGPFHIIQWPAVVLQSFIYACKFEGLIVTNLTPKWLITVTTLTIGGERETELFYTSVYFIHPTINLDPL